MGTGGSPAERRQFGRRRTCLHAVIVPRGRPGEPCLIRDISLGGALLEVSKPLLLPHRFRLHIEANGLDLECEIARRSDNAVGVRFVGTLSPTCLGALAPFSPEE
jgi:hypothetical protein